MKKAVVVLLHFGYWVMYVFFLFVFFVLNAAAQGNFEEDKIGMFVQWAEIVTALAIIPGVFGFYSGYTFIFTRFFSKRKIAALVLTAILAALIAGFLGAIFLTLLKGDGILFADGWNSAIPETLVMCFIAGLNVIVGLVLRGFITSYRDIQFKEELNKKNYEMELGMLKAQINPHFLFNTLNNIDVLINKDPEKASLYLNKLSDILRFMLYETSSHKILLSEELLYIAKFIDLQKIRTSNADAVEFNIEGEAKLKEIEPLLFIPFIENAFKYAQMNKIGNSVSIHFYLMTNKIRFECINSILQKGNKETQYGGLGSELIQKRLNLLYPDKHYLEIDNNGETYKVNLTLYDDEDALHADRG